MTAAARKTFAIVLAAATGVVVTCVVYNPGVMSGDSLGSYREATSSFVAGASQAPLLPFLWRQVLRVAPGPLGLLVFQNLIFWTGLALIACACRIGAVGAALAVLSIGFFPTVFALLGTLWKDVMLAAALTLFVGVALAAAKRSSKRLLALSAVPLWVGMSMRSNALPAAVPLVAWLVVLWAESSSRPLPRRRRLVALALAGALGVYAVSRLTSSLVVIPGSSTSAAFRWSLSSSLTHDLAGLASDTGDQRFPDYVWRRAPDLTLMGLRAVYSVEDVNRLVYGPRWSADNVWFTRSSDEFLELVRVWAGAVVAHPGAYLSRRLAVILSILQVRDVFYPFHTGIQPNNMGLKFEPSPLYVNVTSWIYKTRGLFFRGWAFALVAVVLVAAGLRRHCWSAAAVCASGLLYVSTYSVITTGSDFRYVWWLVVATLLGLFLIAFDRDRPVIVPPVQER